MENLKKPLIKIDKYGDAFATVKMNFKLKVHLGNVQDGDIDQEELDSLTLKDIDKYLDNIDSSEIADSAFEHLSIDNVKTRELTEDEIAEAILENTRKAEAEKKAKEQQEAWQNMTEEEKDSAADDFFSQFE